MLGMEEKSCRPRRAVNRAVLINHGIAVRIERATQAEVRIKNAILIEVYDPQGISFADFAARGFNVPSQEAQHRGLAASVRTDEPHAHSRRDREMNSLKQSAVTDGVSNIF